jgi:hypothetical protein
MNILTKNNCKMKKHLIPSTAFSFLLVLMWIIPDTAVAQQLTKKWFPGHYVMIRNYTSPINEGTRNLVKDNQYIMGYKIHVVWKELEPTKDQYNFTIVRNMIKMAENDGKKLMIHVQDRLFGRNANPNLPDYMLTSEYGGGWYYHTDGEASYGKIWLASYQTRWNKLLRALGEEFDNNQTVAGIMVSESSQNTAGVDTYDKTGHLNFITSMNTTMSTYAPNTIFFQYVNWAKRFTAAERGNIMKHVVEVCKNGFGGPDLMNAELRWGGITKYVLDNDFGSYYGKYRGIAPICTENQAGGYYANDARTLYNYAVNTVGVNFLPWGVIDNNKLVFNFKDDVLPLINEEKGRINTTPPSNIIRTGVSTNEGISGKYSIYPNPVNDMVKLNLNYDYPDGSHTCQLLDITGKVLDTQVIINPSSIIPTSQLVKGTYFLRITDNNLNTETLKFIKI